VASTVSGSGRAVARLPATDVMAVFIAVILLQS
jgi:hypothetical protein